MTFCNSQNIRAYYMLNHRIRCIYSCLCQTQLNTFIALDMSLRLQTLRCKLFASIMNASSLVLLLDDSLKTQHQKLLNYLCPSSLAVQTIYVQNLKFEVKFENFIN